MQLCSNQSTTPIKSSIRPNSLLSRQLNSLLQTRKVLLQKLDDSIAHTQSIQKHKQQIFDQTNLLASIDNDILLIGQRLDHFLHEIKFKENEKIRLIVDIENKSLQLSYLGQTLVECYQYTVSNIDKIRLQMMQIQDHPLLKSLESAFSLRKAVLSFLRDNLLIKHSYQFGLELQISIQNMADQFKSYIFAMINKSDHQNQQNLLEIVTRYTQLLKLAESALHISMNHFQIPHKDQYERFQLITNTTRLKSELTEAQSKLKQLYFNCNKLSRKISGLKQVITNKQEDRKATLLRLQMLKEKVRCMQITCFKEQGLKHQLLQVSQAIQYFHDRNKILSHSKMEIDSSANSPLSHQVYSPSSTASLPQMKDSRVKKQFIALSTKQSKPSLKKLLLNRPTMGRRVSPSSVWK